MSATHDGRRRGILAIDTATSRVVVATGSPDGVAEGLSTWVAGHRHGETLLPSIGRFLGEQNLRRSRLLGIVVGTGPGMFTGLRVGMATAKGMAHGLGIPLVGVSTAQALLASAVAAGVEQPVLVVPAGAADRVLIRPGRAPELLPGGTDPELEVGESLIAVDLVGRAPEDALERGAAAHAGLGAALLAIGAERLRALPAADGPTATGELATLVPEYVTLPRGTTATDGAVAWSRDPR
ncbi:MAG: tRNA (adenosine(37)-N6)-threonylcarbamoyltransferase complex dimerization subunit type 1 TsaB [Candidatus Limnocylindrales bacterium]